MIHEWKENRAKSLGEWRRRSSECVAKSENEDIF